MYDDYIGLGRTSPGGENPWSGYDGASPARITMALLAVQLLAQLMLLGGRLIAPDLFGGPAAQTLVGMGLMVLLAATAVSFLVWFYRAYRVVNVAVGTTHPPGQAAWSFLIPILNLFRPYQIATEIWRKTHDQAGFGHSPLLIGWWALWVVFGTGPLFISMVGLRGAAGVVSPISLGSTIMSVALAICAIAVVRTLDGRIRDRVGEGQRPATF